MILNYKDRSLKTFFKKTQNILKPLGKNLIDSIWKNKFKTKVSGFYSLPNKAVGQNFLSKINILTNEIRKKKVDLQFISSSENIAWLLNIRGQDSDFTPIPHSYALIDAEKKINLFCNLNKVNSILKKKLKGVKLVDINYIDQFLQKFSGRKILIDSLSCSIHFKFLLSKKNNIFEYPDPIYLLKSIKNKTEINNIMKSHIYDGVALTKFLFWVKKISKTKNQRIKCSRKTFRIKRKKKTFNFLVFQPYLGLDPTEQLFIIKPQKKLIEN